jgi:hypothetical protein
MTNVTDLNEPHLKRAERIQGGRGGVQDSKATAHHNSDIMPILLSYKQLGRNVESVENSPGASQNR